MDVGCRRPAEDVKGRRLRRNERRKERTTPTPTARETEKSQNAPHAASRTSRRLRIGKEVDEVDAACLVVPSGRLEEVAASDITIALGSVWFMGGESSGSLCLRVPSHTRANTHTHRGLQGRDPDQAAGRASWKRGGFVAGRAGDF